MKKIIVLLTAVCLILCGCTAKQDKGNYTDEMNIPYAADLDTEYGADSVEREGDHKDSPYFSTLDFYNMESSDTLTILHNFKTQQQTSEWSCGVSSALMIMNWYGTLGEYHEETLAQLRSNGLEPGATSLRQAVEIFDGVGGYDVYSTFDCADDPWSVFTFDYIQENLKSGTPIMVGWNDWGGHWQVIIGYDTMGTEHTGDDVLLMADPFDTSDHLQDGYNVVPAERFFYMWFDSQLFSKKDQLRQWLTAKPKA